MLIVALGNPGQEYASTRHNLGFMLADMFVASTKIPGAWEENKKFHSLICELRTENRRLLVVKPQTYVNRSGTAIAALISFYKLKPEEIIVLHDDLDISLGHIKLRLGGAAGGHHGVESVMQALDTDQFTRLRMGIGTTKEHNTEQFVVSNFASNEHSSVKHMLERALQALQVLISQGLTAAQTRFND
ncbi:aminoacyl-tRNA hydrolase [Candidatus Daviesbacteria bacterium RIFCSPHIGHO2_01_FULL_44_29]|uniref:Peptidyl-tRNA hydrolase n=1 Tax=Candidatus Daviesbacteria bacterium RIFCSPHIGHO2_02_FULL_43_12 TaxID=1797776 RepID=A0A1F5KI45_9BACT|nr:MAG: aminoacyl-tRNA hydrolase [Candidatus Daviesbacteria bacterium RIFCSPHIGHO2_01_FULL_44_29]OGE38994.1 MAG: aminoacyl-tRNA hydrolase [Candidatus Daviesbacteria bacterium RIFCSPHIGHO2_12_FULL_47_45]OGE40613.1 MAG: aminoacyl-tRNA hydrolase [Candidatus Daviesbacteria bacterium RIFCSPHIGHO2_02_FULL_43_12]OGE70453.1 MAG: aminoacyl-tRNA hydrolase [Candidatus Daviesbacteria bacterium RIFCSPLOWO2_01_FULL_43_15]